MSKLQNLPPILDVCCGGKMFYFDKNDPRVLFMDIRRIETKLCDGREFSVDPDIIGDFRDLPFDDETFYGVNFDPPHLMTESNGWQKIKYGALGQDWREDLRKGFAECFRVLKPYGHLVFKWNETNIKISEVLALTPYKAICGTRRGKNEGTYWVSFTKEGAPC